MNKTDQMVKDLFNRILREGCKDHNPRPKYKDGTPAHTLSINHVLQTYDLSKYELPLITLRPIATKSAIGELLWIYQDQSNNLDLLKTKYNIGWWDEWDIGDRTIGACYGESVRKHNLIQKLIDGIKNDPDGRRHIMTLWQEDDFVQPHGLKPCCYETIWNVRHGKDGVDYLDMTLVQRSSDFGTAGCINQTQYAVFQILIARHLGYTPGDFGWYGNNVQIYDRHIDSIKEMLTRDSVSCTPKLHIKSGETDFFKVKFEDIVVIDYPMDEIKKQNPQLTFELGI